jgi:hypothetical protein
MRRRRLRCFSLMTSLLLVAAFFLPFVDVGRLFDDVWDDDGQKVEQSADRSQMQRRSGAPPEVPDASSPTGVFAVALRIPLLEPSFESATEVAPLPVPRPTRPSWFPRHLERGPPAQHLS